MSKQSEAKDRQDYTRELKTCGNCAHFKCDSEKWNGYITERNLRCGIGGFKVHKTATCNEYKNSHCG